MTKRPDPFESVLRRQAAELRALAPGTARPDLAEALADLLASLARDTEEKGRPSAPTEARKTASGRERDGQLPALGPGAGGRPAAGDRERGRDR